MLVQCTTIPIADLQAFEAAILASGRDPGSFKAQMFEAVLHEAGAAMRRVHIMTRGAAAQYDASGGTSWTENFARHLARGFFG